MADENREEVPYLRDAKSRVHDSPLPLVVIEVNHAERRPNEHPKQVPGMLLAGEYLRVRVNMLHRLGIRNHKVLLLEHYVRYHDNSQLK